MSGCSSQMEVLLTLSFMRGSTTSGEIILSATIGCVQNGANHLLLPSYKLCPFMDKQLELNGKEARQMDKKRENGAFSPCY